MTHAFFVVLVFQGCDFCDMDGKTDYNSTFALVVPSKKSMFFLEKGFVPFKFSFSNFAGGALCDTDRKTVSFKIRLKWCQVKLHIFVALTTIFCEKKGIINSNYVVPIFQWAIFLICIEKHHFTFASVFPSDFSNFVVVTHYSRLELLQAS